MNKRSIAVKSDAALPGAAQPGEWEVVEPPRPATFGSFTWSVTKVTSSAGRTRISARTTRLTDGHLVSRRFDGELDGSAFERMAMQAHAQFVEQWRALLRPMSWLFPLPRERDSPRRRKGQ